MNYGSNSELVELPAIYMPTDKTYWKPDRLVYKRKPKPKRALLNRGRVMVLGALALVGLGYWGVYAFFHLDYFQIKSVNVSGLAALDKDNVTRFILSRLEGNRWFTVPRSNILMFSPALMEENIAKEFPAVAEANVKKIFPGGIAAEIRERSLWAIYCSQKNAVLATTTTSASREEGEKHCYFMDEEGIIFGEAPETEGTLIRKITSDGGLDKRLGFQQFSADEITDFIKLEYVFKERAGLAISGIELRKNAPKDLWLAANEGFSIIITRSATFESTADIVKAVLENKVGGERATLDYIDARFGNKVFVKYR